MFASFDMKITNKAMFDDYYDLGNSMFNQNKTNLEEELERFIIMNDVIDGDMISQNWFPSIKADVFISHSHKDEQYVIAFAGWLKEKFKLNAFVDSCAWGYSNDLLRKLDNMYCRTYSNSYSYEKRNVSTSHVHMMLNVALMKMMDTCECLFFVNTPQSLPICDNIENFKSTLSPWIYSEIEMSRYLREREPNRRGYNNPDIILEHCDLMIKYKINTSHMNKINEADLREWNNSCIKHMHPLDILYKQVSKIEGNTYE
ncbi:MAG: hypothetical protein IKI94_06860 [Ruminococcus sp.]|nr:hypothetical protein [Ruminococcus sp.]